MVEGEAGTVVKVQGTLPPSFLCGGSNSDCVVRIVAHIKSSKSDYTCANGDGISQAVIGWNGGSVVEDAFCGVQLTQENWQTEQDIPVRAMMDGLYDQDVTRTLVLYQQIIDQGSTTVRTQAEITTIQVCFDIQSNLSVITTVVIIHLHHN